MQLHCFNGWNFFHSCRNRKFVCYNKNKGKKILTANVKWILLGKWTKPGGLHKTKKIKKQKSWIKWNGCFNKFCKFIIKRWILMAFLIKTQNINYLLWVSDSVTWFELIKFITCISFIWNNIPKKKTKQRLSSNKLTIYYDYSLVIISFVY